MKKVWKNKSIIAIALAVVFTTASMPAARANNSSQATPVELKFLGEVKNQLVFLLNFDGNAEESEFGVTITDESGLTLYTGTVKGEKISKKYYHEFFTGAGAYAPHWHLS